MGKLDNKVCMITGGGSGLGRAGAIKYAQEGAKVIITDINPDRLNESLQIMESMGLSAVGLVGDVRDKEVAKEHVAKAVELYGKLDVLVNSAGIADGFSPVGDVTDEEWNLVLETNLYGTMYYSREAVKVMLPQKSGSIINFSSLCGQTGGRQGAPYVASKWAVIGLTKNTAAMYADFGLRCNAICPGGIPTNFLKDPYGNKIPKNKPFMIKALAGGSVNPRVDGKLGMPVPEECAEVMLFLASDESKLINGVDLTVDGGWGAY